MIPPYSSDEFSELLLQYREGDKSALNELWPMVYPQLRSLAHRHRLHWHQNETLNTTALIHEAYLRFAENTKNAVQNQAHFFALASRIMRSIVLDNAKHRNRQKRGGDMLHVSLDFAIELSEDVAEHLIELDEALQKLEAFDERGARIIEMRIFGGLSLQETAAALDISIPTVTRNTKSAQAWLYRFMHEDELGHQK